MSDFNISKKTWIISVFFIVLVFIMGIATFVFTFRSCQSDKYAAKLDSIPTCLGEIKLTFVPPSEVCNPPKDSIAYIPVAEYKKYIYHLNQQILKEQSALRKRQDDLILDIRQETNNNLEKESAWIAFWITVLTIVGVVCPLGYQIINFNTEKEKVDKLEKTIENTRKKNDEINRGYFVKMNILTFNLLSECRLEESESSEVSDILIMSIKQHYREFLKNLYCLSKDWPDLQIHLCSVLISLNTFLMKLNVKSDFERSRKITDTLDLIRNTLKKIPKASELSELNRELSRIETKLTQI